MKYIYLFLLVIFTIRHSITQSLYFPPVNGNLWDTIAPSRLNWCQDRIDSLYRFLEDNNTRAFLILKDGKIVLEKYFGTHTVNSPWYWASAGKSLTAFLIGLAKQEKYLTLSDLTSQYLGQGWTSCTKDQENKITIRHQLTMTTGLDDGVSDPDCTDSNCLQYKSDAGTRWAYHNAPYTLLDSVFTSATKMNLNAFISSRLSTQTGIKGLYIKSDFNNVFYSTARTMARFGLLILNKGNWNGLSIMSDSAYLYDMTHTSQNLNPAYGYLWWLNGSSKYRLPGTQVLFNGPLNPNAPMDMFAAMGKNGQFLNIVPSQNLIMIRMGDAPDNSLVPFLLNDQIWQHINRLACISSSVDNFKTTYTQYYTDPVNQIIHFQCQERIQSVELYNLEGKRIYASGVNNYSFELPYPFFGIGIIKIQLQDRKQEQFKVFLN